MALSLTCTKPGCRKETSTPSRRSAPTASRLLRVVLHLLDTAATRRASNAFSRLDLPAFGSPTMATCERTNERTNERANERTNERSND